MRNRVRLRQAAMCLKAFLMSAAFTASAVSADDNPLARFVIDDGALDGYTITGKPAFYGPENLWNYIDGGALPYLDYGVTNVVTWSGKLGPDGFEITVDIYDMADSLGAFGIYSSERFPGYDYRDIGVEGYLTENALCFWKDRFYVKVFPTDAAPPSTDPMVLIAEALDGAIPEGGGMPSYFSLFPGENRLEKTESYIAKNVLGQDYLANAFSVRYRKGGEDGDGEYQIYILAAPSADEASGKFGRYRDFLGEYGSLEKREIGLGDDAFTGTEDWYGRMVFVLKGRFILGTMGLSDYNLAKSCLGKMANGL
ncbi:MAG: hypothetical protein J7M24_05675 [Candidatus Latescibacteria bacterium]|nr:hypothetical protein [Candidatus Latescibacterota bacterium]